MQAGCLRYIAVALPDTGVFAIRTAGIAESKAVARSRGFPAGSTSDSANERSVARLTDFTIVGASIQHVDH